MKYSLLGFLLVGWMSAQASADLYSNGFESDTNDWSGVTQVASETGGIPAASGNFYGQADAGAFTRFGGYNYGAGGGVPTTFQEYTTSIDIYLNMGAGLADDSRFDYSSAISGSDGNFLRDFVFNAGFYTSSDNTGPGAGSDRFVISASNNAGRNNSFPMNPGNDPIAITQTGWYTFQDHFYDNNGVLNVDLSIYDASHTLINTWTLGTDSISSVGGNRYGWFVDEGDNPPVIASLAIDNVSLALAAAGAVPEPASMVTWALLGLTICGGAARWKRKRSA
jgi:hypothetical protein